VEGKVVLSNGLKKDLKIRKRHIVFADAEAVPEFKWQGERRTKAEREKYDLQHYEWGKKNQYKVFDVLRSLQLRLQMPSVSLCHAWP
jgi:hypothetical protein